MTAEGPGGTGGRGQVLCGIGEDGGERGHEWEDGAYTRRGYSAV